MVNSTCSLANVDGGWGGREGGGESEKPFTIDCSKSCSSRLRSSQSSVGGAKQEPFPRDAQVVICGGGVIGTSVAYHLPKYGFNDVILLEQGRY